MMKRMICALLALMLGISACGFAMAESGHFTVDGAGSYNNLQDAVKAAKNGSKIQLVGGDLTGCAAVIPSGSNLTIDFGGYTYTATAPWAGSKGTESQAMQLLKDSNITLQNGTLTAKESNGYPKILIQNYANLTLRDFTVDAKNLPTVEYVCSNNYGDTLYTGNTNILAAPGKVAFDVYGFKSYSGSRSVTVDTEGQIDGKIQYDYQDQHTSANVKLSIMQGNFTQPIEEVKDAGNSIKISGGVFAQKPDEKYLSGEKRVLQDDGTGKYMIVPNKEKILGALEVYCNVADSATDAQKKAEYTFTLSLTGVGSMDCYYYDGDYNFVKTESFDFSKGPYTFNLKDSWFMQVENLPVGTQYQVQETNSNGCRVEAEDNQGKIRGYHLVDGSAPFPFDAECAYFFNHPTDEPVVTPTSAPVPTPTSAPVPTPTSAPVPTPTAAPVPTPTAAPVAPAPKTGDNTPIALYGLCAVLAVACAAWLVRRKGNV